MTQEDMEEVEVCVVIERGTLDGVTATVHLSTRDSTATETGALEINLAHCGLCTVEPQIKDTPALDHTP